MLPGMYTKTVARQAEGFTQPEATVVSGSSLPPIGRVSSVPVVLLGLEHEPSDGPGRYVKIHLFAGTHQHCAPQPAN